MKTKKLLLYLQVIFFSMIFSTNIILATNSLIMILDPNGYEAIENDDRAMVHSCVQALQEQTAPILVSSNVLEVIMRIKKQIGDDLKQLQTLIQNSSDPDAVEELAETLGANKISEDDTAILPLLSLIDFSGQNFNCYLNKSTALVLLIPKNYIRSSKPQSLNLTTSEQARACGFNPHSFKIINDFSLSNLLKELQEQQLARLNTKNFLKDLTSCFIPQKQDQEKWIIYITGHGHSAQSIANIRNQIEQDKKNIIKLKEIPQTDIFKLKETPQPYVFEAIYAKSRIAVYEVNIEVNEALIAENKGLLTIPNSAQIAGMKLTDFLDLIHFFDKNMNVAFLHYSTCFGGGYNQTFINETLSSLQANFIVSAEGIDESSTSGRLPDFIPNTAGKGLITSGTSFTKFFKLLELYTDKPDQFVKIKTKGKDPFVEILSTIILEWKTNNQPFIRIPSVGVFKALSLDKSVKNLTQSIVTAHEIEKKSIDLKNEDILMVIVNPPRINAPLDLGKTGVDGYHKAIVFPTPQTVSSSYEAIHIFKEINFEATLQYLLCHISRFNVRIVTQTYIIKKLTGISCEKSGLSIEPGKQCIIDNVIIQIKGISGIDQSEPNIQQTPLMPGNQTPNNIGINIEIAFEYNGKIYQKTIGIKDLSDDDLLTDMATITFTPEDLNKTNMEELANKFLTSSDITKIKKPITLENIVKLIDSKIDTQKAPIITKETQSQLKTGNEDFRRFLEKIER